MAITRDIQTYFESGCGRCELFGTPECKVHTWQKELALFRKLLLECGLTEEVKWGSPTYTYKGTILFMLGAFKSNCVLSFIKGVLLKDEAKILQLPGENSQSARVFRTTGLPLIQQNYDILKSYVFEAMEAEDAGLKVEFKKAEELEKPEELITCFEKVPGLQSAFEALTKGRQRAYLIHFTGSKNSSTRLSRIEKYIPKILEGKGMMD